MAGLCGGKALLSEELCGGPDPHRIRIQRTLIGGDTINLKARDLLRCRHPFRTATYPLNFIFAYFRRTYVYLIPCSNEVSERVTRRRTITFITITCRNDYQNSYFLCNCIEYQDSFVWNATQRQRNWVNFLIVITATILRWN